MSVFMIRAVRSCALSLLVAFPLYAQVEPTREFIYDVRMLPDASYDSSIPSPEALLGFPVGDEPREDQASGRAEIGCHDAGSR